MSRCYVVTQIFNCSPLCLCLQTAASPLTMVAPRPLKKLLQLLQEYGPTAFTQITHFLMLTCMRIYTGPEGPVIVWVVVIDGITIGHPCGLIHNCFVPLPTNRQLCCTVHAASHDAQCAIIGCTAHVMTGHRTCSDPTHQAVETLHHDRVQARFFFFFFLSRLTSFQGEPYVDGIYDVYYVPRATSAQEPIRRPEPYPSPCGDQRRRKAM